MYSLALFLVSLLLFWSVPASARNVALVIGNSAYSAVPALKNPKNDAADMAATFRSLGFEVIEHRDLDRRAMETVLDDFAKSLQGARLSAFFFAGHAIQVRGKNYLLPVDTPILTEDALLQLQRLHLANFQSVMERKSETNLLFVDACRDNPFGRGLAGLTGRRSAGLDRGLARIDAGAGTLISYATAPGAVAADGVGFRNSPYTSSLKQRLSTPNRDLTLILRDVRKDVMAATNDKQIPWNSESLTGDVILRATGGAPPRQPERKSERAPSALASLGKSLAGAFGLRSASDICPAAAATKTGSNCIAPGRADRIRDTLANGQPCRDCPDLVAVPAGDFVPFGATGYAARRDRRRIQKPFLISAEEISFAQWDACVADGGCHGYAPADNGWGRDGQPVINVSVDDAHAYVKWISDVTGQRYFLPSEAQWSYAARAGTSTRWWWGGDADASRSKFGAADASIFKRRPTTTDSFEANAWGLKNVHGNVWEWTSSCWSASVDLSVAFGASQPGECKSYVALGGGWDSSADQTAFDARQSRHKTSRRDNLGFRVVRMLQ